MLQTALNTSTSSNVSVNESGVGSSSSNTTELNNQNVKSINSSPSLDNISGDGANNNNNSSLNNRNNNSQLNEKVAHLATSVYQELEKIVKSYGRDTVKDLMPIVVNVLG